MSQSPLGKDHKGGKKDLLKSDAAGQPDKDESQNITQAELPKKKSYAEIIKGFEEIEKIFKRQDEKGK